MKEGKKTLFNYRRKLKEGKTQADGREVSKLDWPQWFIDHRGKKNV